MTDFSMQGDSDQLSLAASSPDNKTATMGFFTIGEEKPKHGYAAVRGDQAKIAAKKALADFHYTQHQLIVSGQEAIEFARFPSKMAELLAARLIRVTVPRSSKPQELAQMLAENSPRSFITWQHVDAAARLCDRRIDDCQKETEQLALHMHSEKGIIISTPQEWKQFLRCFRKLEDKQIGNYSVLLLIASEALNDPSVMVTTER